MRERHADPTAKSSTLFVPLRAVAFALFCASAAAAGAPARAGEEELWEIYLGAARMQGEEIAAGLRAAALREAERFGSKDPRLARTLATLAEVRYGKDDFKGAEPLYRRAWEMVVAQSDADLREMVSAGLGRTLLKLERADDAAPLLETALELCARRSPTGRTLPSLTASPLGAALLAILLGPRGELRQRIGDLGNNHALGGKWEQRDALYQRWSDRLAEDKDPEMRKQAALLWINKADADRAAKRYDQAITARTRALEIEKTEYGAESKEVADELNMLGVLHSDSDQPKDAAPYFRQALAIAAKVEQASALQFLKNLVGDLQRLERSEEAESVLAEWIERFSRRKDGNSALAGAWVALGGVKTAAKQYPEALAAFEKAVAVWHELKGGASAELGKCHNDVGLVLYEHARYVEATDRFAEAAKIAEAAKDETNLLQYLRNQADSLLELARERVEAKAFGESRGFCERAKDLYRRTDGEISASVAKCINRIGVTHAKENHHDAALSAFRQALKIAETAAEAEAPRFLRNLVGTLSALDREQEAEQPVIEWIALFRARPSAEGSLAGALVEHGRILTDSRRLTEALPVFEEALALRKKVEGEESSGVAGVLNWIGVVHYRADRYIEAEAMYRQAVAIGEKSRSKDLRVYVSNLVDACEKLGYEEKLEAAREKLEALPK